MGTWGNESCQQGLGKKLGLGGGEALRRIGQQQATQQGIQLLVQPIKGGAGEVFGRGLPDRRDGRQSITARGQRLCGKELGDQKASGKQISRWRKRLPGQALWCSIRQAESRCGGRGAGREREVDEHEITSRWIKRQAVERSRGGAEE